MIKKSRALSLFFALLLALLTLCASGCTRLPSVVSAPDSSAPAVSSLPASPATVSSEPASAASAVSSEPASSASVSAVSSSPAPVSVESTVTSAAASSEPAVSSAPETSSLTLSEIYSTVDSEPTPMTSAEVDQSAGAPISTVLTPVASGVEVLGSADIIIDVSNKADGYLMIRYVPASSTTIAAILTGPGGTQYVYYLTPGEWEVFPLSDGSGLYEIGVYKRIEGTKYSVECTAETRVTLKDEFAPFLHPNQYVNFTAGSATVKKAAELTTGCADDLERIQKIYEYVVTTLSYDKQKAASVKSGYLPDLDAVLAAKKGICFDYAALMTAMLRCSGVPARLVVGYSGTAYHAWINAYTAESGWITGAIYFDGTNWKIMDPTFASTGNSSEAIMKYIGNGSNYTAKFYY